MPPIIFTLLTVCLAIYLLRKPIGRVVKLFGIELQDDTSKRPRGKEAARKKAEIEELKSDVEATKELVDASEEYNEVNKELDEAEKKLKAYK